MPNQILRTTGILFLFFVFLLCSACDRNKCTTNMNIFFFSTYVISVNFSRFNELVYTQKVIHTWTFAHIEKRYIKIRLKIGKKIKKISVRLGTKLWSYIGVCSIHNVMFTFRFSSKTLIRLCEQIEGKAIAGMVVIGENQAARSLTLAGTGMNIPVLWSKGGVAKMHGIGKEVSKYFLFFSFFFSCCF